MLPHDIRQPVTRKSARMQAQRLQNAFDRGMWSEVWHQLDYSLSPENVQLIVGKAAAAEAWRFLVRMFGVKRCNHHLLFNCMKMTFSPEQMQKFLRELCTETRRVLRNVFAWTLHTESFDISNEIIAEIGKRHVKNESSPYQYMCCFFKSIESHLFFKLVGREQKLRFQQALRQDDREACVYFSALLAEHWGEWEFLCNLLQTGRVRLYYGAAKIYNEAYEVEQFECAARVLQHLLTVPKADLEKVAGEIFGIIFGMETRFDEDFNWYKDWNSHNINEFIQVCREHGLFSAGALMALWAGKTETVLRLLQNEQVEDARLAVLSRALARHQWKLGLILIRGHNIQMLSDNFCFDEILMEAAMWCSEAAVRMLIRQLVRLYSDKIVLGTLLSSAISKFQNKLFCELVAMDRVSLTDVVTGQNLLTSVVDTLHSVVKYRAYLPLTSSLKGMFISSLDGKRLRVILRKCVEVGMSSLQADSSRSSRSPFSAAVNWGMLEMVRLFYNLGATTNKELHMLFTDAKLQTHLEEEQWNEVRSLLDFLACKPRSLKDLSRLVISRQIGCCADRKHKVLCLNLPLSLTRYILFCDVCP